MSVVKASRFPIPKYKPGDFPLGYTIATAHLGIKKKAGVLDYGILATTTEGPCAAAACVTSNAFRAAPVSVTSELLIKHRGRAFGFVVNSGCANAVTGDEGLQDAWNISKQATSLLSSRLPWTSKQQAGMLTMSTGVIGECLPIDTILRDGRMAISKLDNGPEAWSSLATAFMTTDTFPKLRCRSVEIDGQTIRIAGIAKGAGMINPKLMSARPAQGTLLSAIVTDAAVDPEALQAALSYASDRSFNSITVDGDMSTNDTVIALANGAAWSSSLAQPIRTGTAGFDRLQFELCEMSKDLAQLVVRDGEGATKFVRVAVKGCRDEGTSSAVAKSIASSALVKTALYGEDANWGRILCAIGGTALPSGALDPKTVSVWLGSSNSAFPEPILIIGRGQPASHSYDEVCDLLKGEDIDITVDLGHPAGRESTVWTCDFSHEYVSINGSYRS